MAAVPDLVFRLDPEQVAEIHRRIDELCASEVAPLLEERDRLRAEVERLTALLADPDAVMKLCGEVNGSYHS